MELIIENNYKTTVLTAIINIITVVFIICSITLILRYYIFKKNRTFISYYRQAFVVSAFLVVIIIRIIFLPFDKAIIRFVTELPDSFVTQILEYNGGIFISVSIITIFFLFFHGLTKHKAGYICMMAKKIKEIEENGFGNIIEVFGSDELAQLCQSINHMSLELCQLPTT